MSRKCDHVGLTNKKTLAVRLAIVMPLFILQFIDCSAALAQVQGRAVSCGCYCGVSVPAPCSDEDCKRACGWKPPATGGNNPAGAAASGLQQPFFNLGVGIGQAIGKALVGDPAEEAQRAAEREFARQQAEEEARLRAAEEARKRQEQYDRISSQAQLSEGFDGQNSGPPLMLGDGDDGLRPHGTSFFGLGGGAGGSPTSVNNNAKVVDLRPRQGFTATAAAPANAGNALPLMLGDPDQTSGPAPNTDANVVDLRDKKSPYVVSPNAAKGTSQSPKAQPASSKPGTSTTAANSSRSSSTEEFLFPGNGTFPKNPDKSLLNPLIELPKGESLPQRGESGDEFFARLEKTKLGRKIADEEYHESLFGSTAGAPPYPRGQNQIVDKILDNAIERIGQHETTKINEACRTAAKEMNAAWAEMEKQGIIRPGEDLNNKEKTDVVYENTMMSARHSIYDQLEKDIRAAKFESEHDLMILKQFIKQTQTPAFLGGPSEKAVKDPAQMKRLLNNYMTYYSGYSQ
jgi:hypothetical protein